MVKAWLGSIVILGIAASTTAAPPASASGAPPPQPGSYQTYDQKYEQELPKRNANVPLRNVSLTQVNNSNNLKFTDPTGRTFDLIRTDDYVVVQGGYFTDGYGGKRWVPPETASQYIVVTRGALLGKGERTTIVFNKRHEKPGYDVYYFNSGQRTRSEVWVPDNAQTQTPVSTRALGACQGFLNEANTIGGPVGRCQLLCMYNLCLQNGGLPGSPQYNRVCGPACGR